MRIDGRVKRPLTLDLEELRVAAQPRRRRSGWSALATAAAAGTRRAKATSGTTRPSATRAFTGVPLSTLLEQAGVEDDAIEVVASRRRRQGTHFQRSLPLEVARDRSRAAGLGDERRADSRAERRAGAAGRAALGGHRQRQVAGRASKSSTTPFQGYYNAERYIIVDADGADLRQRARDAGQVAHRLADGRRTTRAGAHVIFGFAWSGHGPIEQVEVSTDDQQTWSPAR